MHKVQITLTPEEAHLLSIKARNLGYNITKYIKLLISKEVLNLVEHYPTFQLSQAAIKKIEKAQSEFKAGKTIKINETDDLDNL